MTLIQGKDGSSAGMQLSQRLLNWQYGEEVDSHLARLAYFWARRVFWVESDFDFCTGINSLRIERLNLKR